MNPNLTIQKSRCSHALTNIGFCYALWHCVLSIGRTYWRNMPIWLKLTDAVVLVPVVVLGIWCIGQWYRRGHVMPAVSRTDKVLLLGTGFLAVWMAGCSAISEFFFPGAFLGSVNNLYDVFVNLLVLVPLGVVISGQGRSRYLKILLWAILILFGIIILVGLYAVFSMQTLKIGGGTIGMSMFRENYPGNRLHLVANPNITGMYCAIFLWLALYLLLDSKAVWKRCACAMMTLILYIALALTDCRAGILAAAMGFGIFVGVAVWHWSTSKTSWFRWLLIIGCGAGAMVLFVKGRDLVYAIYSNRAMAILAAETVSETVSNAIASAASVAASTEARDILVTTGNDGSFAHRFEIYRTAIESLLSSPRMLLFGCGTANVPIYSGYVYTHNQFLEIALAYGVPAMVLFIGWHILLAYKCIRVGLAPKERLPLSVRVLPILIFVAIVNNLAEARLISYGNISGAVYFLTAGLVVGMKIPECAQGKSDSAG